MKSDRSPSLLVGFARRSLPALTTGLKVVARPIVPSPVRRWLRTQQRNLSFWPPIGWVRFGSLRRVTPISPIFGLDRGQSIDRYYIENFLMRYVADIQANVLEVAENYYTRRFGRERVTKSDVLHVHEGQPGATIIADLCS